MDVFEGTGHRLMECGVWRVEEEGLSVEGGGWRGGARRGWTRRSLSSRGKPRVRVSGFGYTVQGVEHRVSIFGFRL